MACELILRESKKKKLEIVVIITQCETCETCETLPKNQIYYHYGLNFCCPSSDKINQSEFKLFFKKKVLISLL